MSDEKIRVPMSTFAESIYLLDGQPFRLTNRNYLKEIYDTTIEHGMIMSGRQVEKSTTSSTHIGNYTLGIPFFKALYFAPLNDQVKIFSKERIGKLYNFSQNDIVNRVYRDKNSVNAVFEKDFINGSVNYFKHCYDTGDNIRGITVNGIWGDEIQDILVDAIPVIQETQSHALDAGAKMKVTWFTGTPKTFSNTIQQYWDRSTQREWLVKCPHCGKYQILGVKNLTPTMYICVKCGKDIPRISIANGRWYALQPGKDLVGFRISQLMVPWITPQDIWKKYTEYPQDKFYNEVLGRSYENSLTPFNGLMLKALFSNNNMLYQRAEGDFSNTRNFMGVDWGKGNKSKTVVAIFSYNRSGKFQMIYCKKYDIGEELEITYQERDIARLMSEFRITYAILDWGFGFTQYKNLKKIFGSRVASCYYSYNLKAEQKWDPVDEKWIVNRTKVISDYVTSVAQLEMEWPGKNRKDLIWVEDNHLCITAEYRKSQNGKSEELFYNHPMDKPDDAMHACIYAKLASILYKFAGSVGGGVQFASAYGSNI